MTYDEKVRWLRRYQDSLRTVGRLVPALQMEEHRQPVRLAPVFRRPVQKKGDHK